MIGPTLKGQRLVALFLFGCLLFNYPVLSLFTGDARLLGIPLIYFYVFAAWAAIITVMALTVERKDP
jgi:predicted permease